MNEFPRFWDWLWSDWGNPHFLTRLGVPRILTNLGTYLLGSYVIYRIAEHYGSPTERASLRLLVHNPWMWSAYVLFYMVMLTGSFLETKYGMRKLSITERIRLERQNSHDIFVRMYGVGLLALFLLLLIGGFDLWRKFK